MASWPYNTATWRRLREAKLRATPLCEPCSKRGQLTPANTVDHRLAISAGGDPFPPLSELASMCHACHNQKTMAIERAGGKGVAFKGCDRDGYPIDENHPTYQGDTPSKDEGSGGADRYGTRIFTKFDRSI
jgi:hypothetical protein